MNNLHNRIDSELNSISFNCDIKDFEKRYNQRRKKSRKVIVVFVGICVICVFSFSFLINQNTPNTNIAGDTSNSFVLTAYAAEISNTDSSSAEVTKKEILENSKAHEILDNDSIIFSEFRIVVENEIVKPEKTYKMFSFIGNSFIGVNGENIKTVNFKSEIAGFRNEDGGTLQETVINYDNLVPENNTVEWQPPAEISYWMEKQAEPDYEFQFTDISHDTVVITVTFTDGTKAEKSLELFFNEDGYLIIKSLGGDSNTDETITPRQIDLYYDEDGYPQVRYGDN